MVQQVSVFLENKRGRLSDALDVLYENCINLRSLAVAETSDYGILRMIPDKPEEAIKMLKAANFIVNSTDVLAVEIEDKCGSMYKIVRELYNNDLDIEYTYSCVPIRQYKVVIIIKPNDIQKASDIIARSDDANLLNAENIL